MEFKNLARLRLAKNWVYGLGPEKNGFVQLEFKMAPFERIELCWFGLAQSV